MIVEINVCGVRVKSSQMASTIMSSMSNDIFTMAFENTEVILKYESLSSREVNFFKKKKYTIR